MRMHQLLNLLAQEEEGMITMVHMGCGPRFVTKTSGEDRVMLHHIDKCLSN